MAQPRIGAGFRYIFYGVVNSNGYMIGSTAAGATSGASAGSGMARLEGARTIPLGLAEGDNVPVSGDDEPLVNFDFESEELPNGILEVSVRNLAFEALIQGTNVETIGDLSAGSLGPSGRASQTMCLLLMRQAKKWTAGARGVKAWEVMFVPSCVIEPLGSNLEQRTFQPYRYKVTVSKADRKPTGATFTEALNGTTAAALWLIESDNPVHLHAFLGDGAEQDIILPYSPVSSSKIHVYDNGVKQTLTTDYTVSGQTITTVGTTTDGNYVNTLYEVSEANLT